MYDVILKIYKKDMGSYLTNPDTEKVIEEKDNYISCTMRGWRKTNEDSHIIHKFGKNDKYVF